MEFDDGLDDEGPTPPLLPPADRLWRHPSEVGTALVARAAVGPSRWVVAVLAGTAGALLATGTTYLAAGHSTTRTRTIAVPAVEQRVEPATMASTQAGTALDAVAITQRVRPAVIRLTGRKGSTRVDGSGVMFRSDGYLLTDAQVAGAVVGLTAVLADNRRLPARVLGTDPDSHVAVVKVDGFGYEVAPLGSTAGVQTNQAVMLVGSTPATDDVPTVSTGKIRGVGRTLGPLSGMIETDIRHAPDAAGGALLDGNGVVIGIVVTPTGGTAATAGWATPIDVAYAAASQLITTGRVAHVWLGVAGSDLDPAVAQKLGVAGGALIADVDEASPAAACGLGAGDIITSIDNRPVASMAAFMVALRTHRPGERVILRVRRGTQDRVVMAILAERPSDSS